MTHNDKMQDLLCFKGENDNMNIKLELSKKFELGNAYNIILSVPR